MNKTWKIITWILFWYYLAPYYLFKRYIFKKAKHQKLWSSLCAVIAVFTVFCCWVNSQPEDDTPEEHVVVKKVGTKRLAQAEAKQKVLDQEEKKKQSEYKKLTNELKKAKKKKPKQQAAADSNDSTETKQPEAASKPHHHGSTNHGDMNTAQTGRIVGNARSKIYHVPGQAGYRMNSANAVYFNTEQDAINAGYRKAKR